LMLLLSVVVACGAAVIGPEAVFINLSS